MEIWQYLEKTLHSWWFSFPTQYIVGEENNNFDTIEEQIVKVASVMNFGGSISNHINSRKIFLVLDF